MTEQNSLAMGSFRRGVLWSSSGSITNLVLLSIETIIAARLLPTQTYGSYVLLLTTVNFLVMVIDFGCKVTTTQLISSGDRARQVAVVGASLSFRIFVIAAASSLILLFRDLLRLVDPSPDLVEYVGYIPLMLATTSLDELLFAVLQGFHAYRAMMSAQIIRSILRVLLTVLLLVVFHAGVAALVYSSVISFAVAIVYQYWSLPVRRLWGWRWETLLEILRFGFSLQLTRLLGFASARLHVVLLGALAGVGSLAYFAVASRIPDALQTLSDSYFRVYFPTMTTLLAAGRRRAAEMMLERSLRIVSFGGALAAVIATVFSREIVVLLFSSKYADSAPVFALLMITLHMTVLVSVLGYTLTADSRPGASLWVSVVRTGVSALADLLLIPGLGVMGAAWGAVTGSYSSNFAGVWMMRRTRLAVAIRPQATQLLVLLFCVTLGWGVQSSGLLADGLLLLVVKSAIVVLFVGLSASRGTCTRADLALVLGMRARDPQPGTSPRPIIIPSAEAS